MRKVCEVEGGLEKGPLGMQWTGARPGEGEGKRKEGEGEGRGRRRAKGRGGVGRG